jgi:hypothetical protein
MKMILLLFAFSILSVLSMTQSIKDKSHIKADSFQVIISEEFELRTVAGAKPCFP